MQRLKDIENSPDSDEDLLDEERSVRAKNSKSLAARSEHSQGRFPVSRSLLVSQRSLFPVSAGSAPPASLRIHQVSQNQISHVSQASQHSKKSQ